MARLFLLRHGQAAGDGLKRFVGQTDTPLGEKGRRQAAWWGARWRPVDFSRIVSSDLARARETAKIIAGNSRQPVETLAAVREIDLGAWENRLFSEIRKEDPDQWHARGRDLAGFRPPGGESFGDLHRRVVPVVREILAAGSGNILVVAHAGVNRVILCDIMGIPLNRLFSLAQDPGGLSLIDAHPAGPRVKAFNLTPELLARLAMPDLNERITDSLFNLTT